MQASNSHDHDICLRWDLKPGDIGYVIYLHGLLYRDDFGWDHTFEGYVAESFADFAIDYNPDRDRLWIAELGDEIVGCIGIHGRSAAQAQLRWYFVLPEARGRGLGRRLLNTALDFCRGRGFESVFLWTVSELEVAAYLYRSVGFRKTEETTHEIWGRMTTEVRYDLEL